jgi:hypothetical protein
MPPQHSGTVPPTLDVSVVAKITPNLISTTDGGFTPKPEGGYTTASGHEVPHDEMNKPWYDIRGDKKQELLVSLMQLVD